MTTTPSAAPLSADKLRERLAGISIPAMSGDNLAITLCSHFDDPHDEEDADDGWSNAALNGCNSTLDAIHAHYDATLTAKDEIIAGLTENLRDAEANADNYIKHTYVDPGANNRGTWKARAETAESRVKVLEEALRAAAEMLQFAANATEDEEFSAAADEATAVISPPTQVAPKEGT